MFAWSVCSADSPVPGHYEVYDSTGGHMKKYDMFEIQKDNEDTNKFKFIPKDNPNNPDDPKSLKNRWKGTVIELEAGHGSKSFDLCGFIDIDTTEHKGNQYGHDKTHGILVKAVSPGPDEKPKVRIIWSALPLKSKNAENCNKLEKRFHGGMAHASQ
jgi:hypothetical protein